MGPLAALPGGILLKRWRWPSGAGRRKQEFRNQGCTSQVGAKDRGNRGLGAGPAPGAGATEDSNLDLEKREGRRRLPNRKQGPGNSSEAGGLGGGRGPGARWRPGSRKQAPLRSSTGSQPQAGQFGILVGPRPYGLPLVAFEFQPSLTFQHSLPRGSVSLDSH